MGRRDEPAYADDVPEHLLELVTYMAKHLVKYPDEVAVEIVDGERRPIIELRVNQEDLGQVIGRNGRTSKAMRLLVNAAATKASVRVDLDIIDDED